MRVGRLALLLALLRHATWPGRTDHDDMSEANNCKPWAQQHEPYWAQQHEPYGPVIPILGLPAIHTECPAELEADLEATPEPASTAGSIVSARKGLSGPEPASQPRGCGCNPQGSRQTAGHHEHDGYSPPRLLTSAAVQLSSHCPHPPSLCVATLVI